MGLKPPIWLGVALLIAVLIIFIAPSVDLEPSALRASRAATEIFLGMVLAARLALRIPQPLVLRETGSWLLHLQVPDISTAGDSQLFDRLCVRLC